MSKAVITDNWVFQSVGQLLSEGLSPLVAKELVIAKDRKSYTLEDVPYAAIQIEALFNLLTNIVLRDSLVVDERYLHTWEDDSHHFDILRTEKLLAPQDFVQHQLAMAAPRNRLIGTICGTSGLTEHMKAHKEYLALTGEFKKDIIPSLLWGTAAMLARSHVQETAYAPHPLRQRLIARHFQAEENRDIVSETVEHVQLQRTRFYAKGRGKEAFTVAQITLPPIVVEIIENSKDVNELVERAVGFREWHKDLRTWCAKIQAGLEDGSKATEKFQKSIARSEAAINRRLARSGQLSKSGSIDLSFSESGLGLKTSLITLSDVLAPFRAHTMLVRAVLTKRGEDSLNRLLGLFGDKRSSLGESVRTYLRENQQRALLTSAH